MSVEAVGITAVVACDIVRVVPEIAVTVVLFATLFATLLVTTWPTIMPGLEPDNVIVVTPLAVEPDVACVVFVFRFVM